MANHSLIATGGYGGDPYEQAYYDRFIRDEFPNYEKYWSKFVVDITNRPSNIDFKSPQELEQIPDGKLKRWNAQIHYTLLFHLCRVYDIKELYKGKNLDINALIEGIARLVSATDLAFELIGRKCNPGKFTSLSSTVCREAREAGKSALIPQIEDIRTYRNYLAHSSLVARTPSRVPKLGKQRTYLDWAAVMEPNSVLQATLPQDFDFCMNVLVDAWDLVLSFLNDKWENILLK